MKRIVAIALTVLMIAALFVGCGGASGSAEGKYYIKSINGQSVSDALKEQAGGLDVEALLGMMGIKSVDEIITMELTADGKAVMASAMMDDLNAEGTWTQDGSKVTITIDGSPADFVLSGNELSGKSDSEEMVFVRK